MKVDALIENNGTVGLGLRVMGGGCANAYAAGYFFDISDTGIPPSPSTSLLLILSSLRLSFPPFLLFPF